MTARRITTPVRRVTDVPPSPPATDPLEAARAELAEAKAHEERLRQLVAEGKANADALATAQYRVSNAGKAIARLLAEAAPEPTDAA